MTRRVTLALRHGAEAVALVGDDPASPNRPAVRERRAHDRVFVEADRRLQRAADQAEGKDAGQHRAGEPAQADAAAVGRAVGDVARVERIVVAEVDHRPLQALSLESGKPRSPFGAKQFSRD